MTHRQHGLCLIGLLAVAAGMLCTMEARTDLIFPDGLRYIDQAQKISQGALSDGLVRSIDHPGYPLVITAIHAVLGGEDPVAWERSAQAAAVLAGVLLVIPLYLMGIELIGPRVAWLGCLLVYLAPIPCRVMADAMSESTFLLFWTWGLWAAIRFLKAGALGWLPLLAGFGVASYLTRPEGLLLPAAMVATLLLTPFFRATRLSWTRWGVAVGFLVVAPLCLVGPYIIAKGGLGTKPALARVLGSAPRAPADSIDRTRPLDPNQTVGKTYLLAAKGTLGAVAEAISIPLLPLVAVGLWRGGPASARPRARRRLFLVLVAIGAILALVRLHVTCGYCTSRHAILLGLLLIPAAAAGLDWLLSMVPLLSLNPSHEQVRKPGLALLAVAAVYLAWSAPGLLRPINHEGAGYRLAGQWLVDRTHAPEDAKVVDGTGWSLFYGNRTGYTFANLSSALNDPAARFVVVREAHLLGPWGYCQTFRDLVRGRQPVAVFPARPDRSQSRVFVFDRSRPLSPPSGIAEGNQGITRLR
jgi:4-amino-4-deoxy-L-arabinose transferase-like glycosyltransferase